MQNNTGTITVAPYATILEGPGAINIMRLATLASGLRLEMKGLRLSRGRSCLAIAKQTTGLRTNNRAAQLAAVELLLEVQRGTVAHRTAGATS